MAQYDKIAKKYADYSSKQLLHDCVYHPTIIKLLGNVSGKKILDVACGGGDYSRVVKKMGAAKVVGVDISRKMIDLAKKQEEKDPLGIDYEVFDVTKMPKIDEFDIVIAVFLLHYSKSKEELDRMCRNIFKNLKKDGKLLALINHPIHQERKNIKYQAKRIVKNPGQEGSEATVILYENGKETVRFKNYCWKKETYEKSLKKAGFQSIEWRDLEISPVAIKEFGKKFWQDYIRKPSLILIECVK